MRAQTQCTTNDHHMIGLPPDNIPVAGSQVKAPAVAVENKTPGTLTPNHLSPERLIAGGAAIGEAVAQ
jgi:hypothetical protein